jgi:membrane fusion protein (multidrug efflux system)
LSRHSTVDNFKNLDMNLVAMDTLRKIRISLALLAAAALAAGCRSGPAAETHAAAAEVPPIDVKLAAAREIKVPRVLTLSGTLVGAEQAKVAAGAVGKVLATYVERGSLVRKGAVMVRLDARALGAQAAEAAAQVESLKAQQVQAQLDCERVQRLFDKGAISKADYDRTRTQCETSRWSVSAAEAHKSLTAEALRDTEIRAPFTGMVVERTVSPGEYVRADTAIATLVDVDSLRVELTVPETDLPLVRQGMTIDFRTAGPGEDDKPVRHGRVRYVGPAVRQQTRDAVVEAVVDNAGHDLRPGMFVTARLALGEQTLPAVPEKAVRAEGTQRHVFVNVGGRLEDRLVQLGAPSEGMVSVASGIKPGDEVVAEVTADVRDGAKIKVR